MDEGTVGYESQYSHGWKEQLSCSCSVDDGPTKNSEPVFIYIHSKKCYEKRTYSEYRLCSLHGEFDGHQRGRGSTVPFMQEAMNNQSHRHSLGPFVHVFF